jgi:DNA-binding CsgD family transcriptional regulator
LAGWLADQAVQRGWLLLQAAPAEAERGLPFAGLADLLGPYLSGIRDALPGPLASALDAALLQTDPPAGGRADLAVRLGMLEALRALAQHSRCAVVVDDVQWLDAPTSRALGFALRRLGGEGPLAVFSCRSGVDVPDAIGELLAGGIEVTLAPMSVPELAQVVAERLSAGVPDPAAHALHHASGGNPMFAIELARALPGSQLPEAGLAPPPVPGALQGLLRARVEALPPSARAGVLLLAAAGRLHASDLAVMLGPQLAESTLAAAADAGLTVRDTDGTLRFSHPLLAGLAYTDAPPADRRAAHARLAAHLPEPERRAWHLAASVTVPDAAVAAELSAASRLAAARGALHTAAELAEGARRLTPLQDKEPGWERGFAAAQLYDAADQPGRATTLFRGLAQSAPTPSHKARALLELSELAGHDFVTAQALAEQAVKFAGGEGPTAAYALGHLGTILLTAGDNIAAGQVLHHAAECARATGAPDAELRALHTLVMLELYAGTADLSPLLADVARVAADASNARGFLHPATRTGLVSMVRDDLAAARAAFSRALADAENAGDYATSRRLMALLAEASARDGDLPAAAQVLARLQQWDPYTDDGPLLKVTALVAAYRGECDIAVKAACRGAELSRSRNDTLYVAANLSVLGFLEVSRGSFAAALPPLREARDVTRQMGIREPGIFRWHQDHIEACLAGGFPEEAAELVDELNAQAAALGRPALRALAGRCAGLLQAATGDTDAALDTLADATGSHGAEPSFEQARTLLAYGTVARRARRKAVARDALAAAQAIFTSTGTVLWAQRAGEELRRVGLRSSPGTLTETERRIAELVQAGQTNREVAAELFLTPKTVEANLSRIYHKLHIRSRTQLARALSNSQEP